MTSYHFVEEQNTVDYRCIKEFEGKYIDQQGKQKLKTYALLVRSIEKGVKTDVKRVGDFLSENNSYKGDKYNEGYGLRMINFRDLYEQTEKIIKEGKAIDYLYSIDNTPAKVS